MFAKSKVLLLSDVLEARKMDEHKNLSEFEEQRLACVVRSSRRATVAQIAKKVNVGCQKDARIYSESRFIPTHLTTLNCVLNNPNHSGH